MVKQCIQFFLGLNGASVVRGLRLGFPEFINGCFASMDAAHPLQDRTQNSIRKAWQSIPEVTLDEILGNRKAAVKLNVQMYEDGMLPTHEAMALLAILMAENPSEVLEIGTYMGHTTRAMAEMRTPSARRRVTRNVEAATAFTLAPNRLSISW